MAATRSAQVQRCVACFAVGADGSPVLGNAVIGNVQPLVNHVADDLNDAVALRVDSGIGRAPGIYWFIRIEHGSSSRSCGIYSPSSVLPRRGAAAGCDEGCQGIGAGMRMP